MSARQSVPRATLRALLLAAWAGGPAQAFAAEGPPGAAVPASAPRTTQGSAPDAARELRRDAQRMRDLIAGQLDPGIDPATLFTLELTGPVLGEDPGAELRRLLEDAGAKGRRRTPRAAGEDPVEEARAELISATAEWLRRTPAERRELLRRHEERRSKAEEERREGEVRLAALETAAARFAAYLEGKLEPEVDPATLLRVDLLDEAEIGADPARRRRFLAGDATTDAAPSSAEAPLGARIEAARRRLDALRMRWLSLPPEERARLEAVHRGGPGPQQAAERARAEASRDAAEERVRREEAVQRAETEAARLAAEEQMKLLDARTSLAAAERELESLAKETEASRERAIGWVRRARDLEARVRGGAEGEPGADDDYARLVAELTVLRRSLTRSLGELGAGSRIPDPPRLELAAAAPEVEAELEEVAGRVGRLRAREERLLWERATAERNAMVTMNEVRLRLLDRLSPKLRDALRGPGREGLQQALRETTQIALELRYHRHALPRAARARIEAARQDPWPEIAGFLQLGAVLALFRWWRVRSAPALRGIEVRLKERRPPSPIDRAAAAIVWYLRRVREPLEWLALVLVLGAFPVVSRVGELSYLFLFLAWALAGWTVTKLLDALAARSGTAGEGTADLRWRSLRLSGVTVVAAGLLLSVAERSVGRGALYAWITRLAWLAGLAVALLLVSWWRPTVFSRIRLRESRGPVLEWALQRSSGAVSYLAAAVGGAWLLAEGVLRFLSSQAGRIGQVRRILAWLFRREVERRNAAQVERAPLEPLPAATLRSLDPEEGETILVEPHGREELRRVREVLAARGSTVAVIAERGAGKTTLLARILDGPVAEGVVRLACRPGGGFDGLVADLHAACELDGDPSIVKVAQALRERRPPAVVVDDAQRMVHPVIGGLADVDRLLGLTRAVGQATSWVVAIGTPGYGYLERARGGRVTFDAVVRLPAWSPDGLGALLRARTAAAGLAPSFEEIVAPGPAEPGESRLERAERDYHGLLWDASGGNAAVALHLWQRSLGLRPGSGEAVVRLPEAPRAEDLDEFPANLFFVLRAVLQLELAVEQDVALCTGLRAADVADALRAARVRGITEARGERLRLSLHWYRAVTQALRRRHLLAF